MRPVEDVPLSVGLQDNVGRVEVAVADLLVDVHTRQAGVQLVAGGRVEVGGGNLALHLLRQAVEHRAGAGVNLHLNVNKQVQVLVFLFRMRRHQRRQRVAFNELRRNRPLTVHRVNSQQLGNRQARLFHARRVQRFVQNVRLAVPFSKHLDGLGAVAVNLLILPLGNHMRQIHRETSFYMVHVYWGERRKGAALDLPKGL